MTHPLDPSAAEAPRVSFFVTAYRQEQLVAASIEAAFAQTGPPLEILLSDDCSPDGTFAVMQAMAAAYDGPHTVLLNRNPRNSASPPTSTGSWRLTSGDFVVQNAGDDVATPDRTSRLVAAWLGSATARPRRSIRPAAGSTRKACCTR